MRSICLALLLAFIGFSAASCATRHRVDAGAPTLEPADIDRLCGSPWVGSLIYLDYTSGQHTTIDSSLTVRKDESKPAAWEFGMGYSKEPHADSRELVTLSADGALLGTEDVIVVQRFSDGRLLFVTECDGTDDNRPARFRFEHELGQHTYSRRKMVKLAGTTEWFERHVYRWSR
ncbi:MAG: hypothetical protein NTV94_14920 [Planctomycetota bacterium]|nr:hypothetical protein [Planctomycetota bacterium]